MNQPSGRSISQPVLLALGRLAITTRPHAIPEMLSLCLQDLQVMYTSTKQKNQKASKSRTIGITTTFNRGRALQEFLALYRPWVDP